jgi:hypothetical protein
MKLDKIAFNSIPSNVAEIDAIPPRSRGGAQSGVGDSTTIVIRAPGWYRIATNAMMYSSSYGVKAGKITLNGEIVAMTKEDATKETTTLMMDYVFRGKVNDRIRVLWTVEGANPAIRADDDGKTHLDFESLSAH